MFGMPFPTWLGWIIGPVSIIVTALISIWCYVKSSKEHEEPNENNLKQPLEEGKGREQKND